MFKQKLNSRTRLICIQLFTKSKSKTVSDRINVIYRSVDMPILATTEQSAVGLATIVIYLVDVVSGARADLSPLFQVSFCGVPGQGHVLNLPFSEFLHEI